MRVFTVIGPSQSGKSTLVAALAGLEGGRGTTRKFMGDASVTTFDFMGDAWAAFDLPGRTDSLAQAGAALAASDAAILCIPAEADAAVLSAPYLRILEASGVPTLLFVNKIDAATDRVADIAAALQSYSAHKIVLRQVPMRNGDQVVGAIDLISERAWEYHEGQRSSLVELPEEMEAREQEARADLLESLADFDDTLLEQIIEDQRPMTDEVYGVATRVLQQHDLVPALLGAAASGNGILRLMKSLRHEAPEVEALRARLDLPEDVLAAGCMADVLKHLGKTVLVRALAPGVAAGAPLGGGTIGSLTEIDAKTQAPQLEPGALGLTIKSDHLSLGGFLTAEGRVALPEWARPHAPALRRLAKPVHEKDEGRLSAAAARLAEIDPGLDVGQDEATGHLLLGLQGPQHLRLVTDKLAEDFGIEVECSEVPAPLRETIRRGCEKHYRHRKQSGGAGQFADVVIDLKPMPAEAGFLFEEVVKGGAVPRNYIPAVEAGARDALEAGPQGHPVVDVGVTLKDGKAHSVDSSDFAFRTAGKNAVKEALAEVGTVVLQPIAEVTIHVPTIFAGGLVQLVSGLKGQVLGFEGDPDAPGWDIFRAMLPVLSEEELGRNLSAATRGTAWYEAQLDHYQELH
jgi:elongation factor G